MLEEFHVLVILSSYLELKGGDGEGEESTEPSFPVASTERRHHLVSLLPGGVGQERKVSFLLCTV